MKKSKASDLAFLMPSLYLMSTDFLVVILFLMPDK